MGLVEAFLVVLSLGHAQPVFALEVEGLENLHLQPRGDHPLNQELAGGYGG
jgi:hypothetical protein